jgi:RNA polymerase sigma-70 factor, ECF subfamily
MNTSPSLATQTWTEPEAIRAAQDGDSSAFEFLYALHSRHVYRVILGILKNDSDAEDLTQQVFLSLFRNIRQFRGDARLSTWLHRVALNAAFMHIRRRRPVELQTDSLDADSAPPMASSDHSMRSITDRIDIPRALRKLPAGCRRLFVLYVVLGFEHSEIAQLLGCSIGCSKSQLHKARKRLRAMLSQVSPEEPVAA